MLRAGSAQKDATDAKSCDELRQLNPTSPRNTKTEAEAAAQETEVTMTTAATAVHAVLSLELLQSFSTAFSYGHTQHTARWIHCTSKHSSLCKGIPAFCFSGRKKQQLKTQRHNDLPSKLRMTCPRVFCLCRESCVPRATFFRCGTSC